MKLYLESVEMTEMNSSQSSLSALLSIALSSSLGDTGGGIDSSRGIDVLAESKLG